MGSASSLSIRNRTDYAAFSKFEASKSCCVIIVPTLSATFADKIIIAQIKKKCKGFGEFSPIMRSRNLPSRSQTLRNPWSSSGMCRNARPKRACITDIAFISIKFQKFDFRLFFARNFTKLKRKRWEHGAIQHQSDPRKSK